jgi:Calx-beta domain
VTILTAPATSPARLVAMDILRVRSSFLRTALMAFVPSLLGSAAFAAWVAPAGVPTPSFGVNEVAPALPNPWTLPVAGFYYVNATGTASGNGTPSAPRGSIPSNLPAGSVLILAGTYTRSHAGGTRFSIAGSAAKPVFIQGAAGATVTGEWEITGTYGIVEKLKFAGTGSSTILAPANHIAVRDIEVVGTPNSGGFGIQTYDASNTSDVVVLRALVHDNGNWLANFDQDVHGIGVYRANEATGTISNVWILDSEFYHNSGDGVQINGNQHGSNPNEPNNGIAKLHHVYLGRNVSHHNKQTGYWTKQASDVVFSENVSYSHHPSDSSPGSGMGGQYGPERVWFLYNRIYDCDFGIGMSSDWTVSDNRSHYYIGNTMYRIHSTTGFNPDTGYSEACVSLIGGTNRYVIGNTCHDADSGVRTPSGGMTVAQNIFSGIKANGAHIYQEGLGTMAIRRNLTDVAARYVGTPACTGCLVGPPNYVDSAAGDFNLGIGSAAMDAGGAEESVYATYQSTYGVSIRKGRPINAWDIGAWEANIFKPDIAIGDLTVAEGNSGLSTAALPVTLSGATSVYVYVNYATANGTAVGGSDFVPASGTVVFPPGSVSQQAIVSIVGDRVYENPESFVVNLTSANWGTIMDGQGSVSIINDDAQGFSVNDVDVVEPTRTATTTANFVVTLSPTLGQTTTVAYTTANGTATAGADYDGASGTLTFAANASTATVPVTVNADGLREAVETFTLNLSSPTGGAAIAAAQGTARIYGPGSYFTLPPCRVLDTRNPVGALGLGGPALAGNSTRVFKIASVCGIPPSATAVSLNLTITQPTRAGDLRAYPSDRGLPLTSVINYAPGATRANNALVGLSAAGQISIRCDQPTGTVHLIVDVTGYVQ